MNGNGSLAGALVLDASRVLAGPFAGQFLGGHGAEVIKVRAFDGDDMGPSAMVRTTKQAVNACANALSPVASFMDVEQALVCQQSREAISAREAFSR